MYSLIYVYEFNKYKIIHRAYNIVFEDVQVHNKLLKWWARNIRSSLEEVSFILIYVFGQVIQKYLSYVRGF